MKYKQTGITVGLSNPVISAAQTVGEMAQVAKQTKDGRMQALAAATATLSAKNAAEAVIAGNTPQLDNNRLQVLDANGNNTAQNPINQVGGISLNVSIGASKSSSHSEQNTSTARSSTLTAGNASTLPRLGLDSAAKPKIFCSNIDIFYPYVSNAD